MSQQRENQVFLKNFLKDYKAWLRTREVSKFHDCLNGDPTTLAFSFQMRNSSLKLLGVVSGSITLNARLGVAIPYFAHHHGSCLAFGPTASLPARRFQGMGPLQA